MMKKVRPDTLEAIIEHAETMHKQSGVLLNVSLELDQVYEENKHKDELISKLSEDIQEATDQINRMKVALSEEQNDNTEKETEIQKLKANIEELLHDVKERDKMIAKLTGNSSEELDMDGYVNKFIVIKSSDAYEHLSESQQITLREIMGSLEENQSEKKHYLVINTDEPYASEVARFMRANGHWS